MPKNEQEFTPQESLQLIHRMLENTRNNISNSSKYYLLWGWAVMIGCLLQYYLKVIAEYPKYYKAWLVTPVAIIIHFIMLAKDAKHKRVRTFVEEGNASLWMAIGFSFFAMAFIFSRIGWQYSFPFYIILYGIGTFVSGSLLQFKPLRLGGACCLVLSIVTVYVTYDLQILITALAILLSYIIPGHMLRHAYKNNLKTYSND